MFIESSMGTSSKMYSSYETHITSSKVSSRVYTCNRFSTMAKYSQSFYSVEKRYIYIYIYSSFSSPCQWHHSPFILILQWLRPTFDPLCWPVSVMGKTAKKQVAVAPLRRLMGKSPPDGPKAKGMKPKKPLIQTKGVKDTKRKVKETLKESKTTTKKVEKPKGQVGKSGVSEPSQRRSALRKPVAKENSDDFPDDELERFYYMKKPREVNRRQVTSDSTQVKADANLDNDMLNALVDENEGVMRAGALPECFASNTAGQKALMDGLFDGVVAAPKKKAKKEEEKSKEVQPKTLPQKACDLMADILSDSTKARKKSMSLGAVNYAGELSNQLLDFAKKMERSYKTLQKATNNNVDKEDFYLKIFAEVAKQREWFVQAEAWLGLKLL